MAQKAATWIADRRRASVRPGTGPGAGVDERADEHRGDGQRGERRDELADEREIAVPGGGQRRRACSGVGHGHEVREPVSGEHTGGRDAQRDEPAATDPCHATIVR